MNVLKIQHHIADRQARGRIPMVLDTGQINPAWVDHLRTLSDDLEAQNPAFHARREARRRDYEQRPRTPGLAAFYGELYDLLEDLDGS